MMHEIGVCQVYWKISLYTGAYPRSSSVDFNLQLVCLLIDGMEMSLEP